MARTSVATDDFSGTLSNWTQINNYAGGDCSISSGQLVGNGAGGLIANATIMRSAESFNNDQYSKVKIQSMGYNSTSYVYAAMARCSGDVNTVSSNTMDYYAAVVPQDNSAGAARTCYLSKVVNGVRTDLNSQSIAFDNDDTLAIEVEGTTLRFFKNDVEQFTTTDSSLSSGKPGVILANLGRMDDWEGGNISSGASSTGAAAYYYSQQ